MNNILDFMADIIQQLLEVEQGDPSAADQLLPLVYEELRKLAAARLGNPLQKLGYSLWQRCLVCDPGPLDLSIF